MSLCSFPFGATLSVLPSSAGGAEGQSSFPEGHQLPGSKPMFFFSPSSYVLLNSLPSPAICPSVKWQISPVEIRKQ